jgi:hypothetical protein
VGGDRRRFLALSAAALVGGTGLAASACGSPTPAGPAGPEGESGSISLNHGHAATLTAAQLQAGTALVLEIQGASIHGHTVELTADDVARIRRGETVSLLSSAGWEDKHDHRVVFNG